MKAVAGSDRSERTPPERASKDVIESEAWRDLPPHLQDFVAILHASGGRDLAGAAARLGVASSVAREICAANPRVAQALRELGLALPPVPAVEPPRKAAAPPVRITREVDHPEVLPRLPAPRPVQDRARRRLDLDALARALLAGKSEEEAAVAAGSEATSAAIRRSVVRLTIRKHPDLRRRLEEGGYKRTPIARKPAAPASPPQEDPEIVTPEPSSKVGWITPPPAPPPPLEASVRMLVRDELAKVLRELRADLDGAFERAVGALEGGE